jgi:hypothetical protein
LPAAISTVQAVAAAFRLCVVGAIAAAGAPTGTVATRPQPTVGPPFITASASAPAGPAAGAVGSLAAAAAVGIPVGTAVGAAGTWDTASIAGAPADTAAGPASRLALAGTAACLVIL